MRHLITWRIRFNLILKLISLKLCFPGGTGIFDLTFLFLLYLCSISLPEGLGWWNIPAPEDAENLFPWYMVEYWCTSSLNGSWMWMRLIFYCLPKLLFSFYGRFVLHKICFYRGLTVKDSYEANGCRIDVQSKFRESRSIFEVISSSDAVHTSDSTSFVDWTLAIWILPKTLRILAIFYFASFQ